MAIDMSKRIGASATSPATQEPPTPSECVVCLSGCTLLFADDPPLYFLCVQQCLQRYCG